MLIFAAFLLNKNIMRKLLFVISLLEIAVVMMQAQVADTSIVQYLERSVGTGKVKIIHDARLSSRLARANTNGTASALPNNNKIVSSYITVNGYRIQVFSDNNQRKSKDEANYKAQLIRNLDPTIETYVSFTSPFWRLRVGDFRTYEEANTKLRELKQAFPSFAKEMRIVRESVRVPQY